MCFQAAYVCFGVILMREYAFHFANGSLRVNRVLRNVPWYSFLEGTFCVLFGGLLVGRWVLILDFRTAWQHVNTVLLMIVLGVALVIVLQELGVLVQSWRAWWVLGRLNAVPVSAWRLVAVEAKGERNIFFSFFWGMANSYGYKTRVLGKTLRVALWTGNRQSWQYNWQPWQVQVNGQSLLLAVARDDGEAVVPLDGELNCWQGLSDAEREGLKGESRRAVEVGVVEAA